MFFQPTEEEIKKASEGSKVPFKDKQEYVFMFEDIKEKNEEEPVMIIETKIIGGEFDGRKHSFWFRPSNEYDRATLLTITDGFMKREELGTKGFHFSTTIGSMFKGKAVIGKKGYTNFYTLTKVDSGPGATAVPAQANNIPF